MDRQTSNGECRIHNTELVNLIDHGEKDWRQKIRVYGHLLEIVVQKTGVKIASEIESADLDGVAFCR